MLLSSPAFSQNLFPLGKSFTGHKNQILPQIQTMCCVNAWPVITVAGRANTSLLWSSRRCLAGSCPER